MWVNPDICDVFLRWQAECGKVFCVALSKTRCLVFLNEKQDNMSPREQTHTPLHESSCVDIWNLNHLHLGHKAELVFDLQENWVKGQLVGLLVESGQGRSWLRQQAGITRALLLQHKGKGKGRELKNCRQS